MPTQRRRRRAAGAHLGPGHIGKRAKRPASFPIVGIGASAGGLAIKAEGGITFAQDQSARYDSMPRSAVAAGCVDFVLSPKRIAKELARIAKHPYLTGKLHRFASEGHAAAITLDEETTPRRGRTQGSREMAEGRVKAAHRRGERPETEATPNGLTKILLLLRKHSGVDFSLYKSPTIQRRIARRMALEKQDSLESYANFLRGNAKGLDALYSDVLISVTSFFRDPRAFTVLVRNVFPKLIAQRGDEPLRAWVPGCSTGQEAYSIAMAFVEASDSAPRMRELQVFATDLNEALLEKARRGLYARNLAQDVSPERLRRFFVEEQGGYRINKTLREMVVFARQNLIADPPFSRMDLISCRNLLIYLEPSVQKQAIPTFHYALKPGGFLLLGASESIGAATGLFEPVDKKHKIYLKKAAPSAPLHVPLRKERAVQASSGPTPRFPLPTIKAEMPEGFRDEQSAEREADRVTVNHFAPPGVLVNADLQVLQFRGATSAYLEPPKGRAAFDVLKMAREGLMLPLRAAINKARKDNKTARRENVRIGRNGKSHTINIEVIPLKNLRERCYLILFEEPARTPPGSTDAMPQALPGRGGGTAGSGRAKELARRLADVDSELSDTRDYVESMREQHEATTEELQAANEEVQSANEELQSVNEELETSKEELESTNEELLTVNEEMANRYAELNRVNSDLVNLQAATRLAIVLLGRDLTIRRFSAQAEKQFNLCADDIGRPIGSIRHNLAFEPSGAGIRAASYAAAKPKRRGGGAAKTHAVPRDLEQLLEDVIDSVQEREQDVRDDEGHWHSLRVRPYLTLDNKVDGAVLVLVDIDALKRHELAIREERDYAEAIVNTVRDPLLILSADLHVEAANPAFYAAFNVSPADAVGRSIYELGSGQWNIPRLRELLEDILPKDNVFNDFEVTHDFEGIGRRTVLLNARAVRGIEGQAARILLGIEDATDRLRVQRAQSDLSAHLQAEIESERMRIARDIHDELGAALTAIRMELTLPRDAARANDHGRRDRAIVRRIDAAIEVVRRICSDLRPSLLDNMGLRAAIEWLAEDVQKRTGIRIDVQLEGLPGEPPADQRTALFRIVQEAVTNAIRHSGASALQITQRSMDSMTIVSIADNGRGIKPAEMSGPRSFGIIGMQERAKAFGGSVSISGGRRGTRVTIRLPNSTLLAE